MAWKKRNRNRKRRSEAARIERHYINGWRDKGIIDALNADEFREKQSMHQKEIALKIRDLLSRSIFVTSVKDLNISSNLSALERFFARQYGPVQSCVRTSFGKTRRKTGRGNNNNRYPPARIVFFRKENAEKVFGFRELYKVREAVEIYCPGLGYKNEKIMVRPCMPSNDLLLDGNNGLRINLAISGLLLGHWCPAEQEMETLNVSTSPEPDVWLGADGGVAPQVTIDIQERCIELTHSNRLITDRISFRFKQLTMPMTLCREENAAHSIIFSLKHAPKVERMEDFLVIINNYPEFERSLRWGNIEAEALGACLGYKLQITDDQILMLLRHEKFNQLRDFGVIGFNFDAFQNPSLIQSIYVGYDFDAVFENALIGINSFKLASTLSVLKDNGRFTSYHAMIDKVEFPGRPAMNIVDLVKLYDRPSHIQEVENALEKILGGYGYTKYPCRLLCKLLKGAILAEASTLPDHCVLVPRVRVSPLRTLCAGFEIETSNRAIREFTSMPTFEVDMFMRVTVIDEDGGILMGTELTGAVETRIRSALAGGIVLCGRKYEFLAYSSSQLKECSVWMVCCAGTGWSVTSMRQHLGDFSRCTTASKLGARLGQCFSTTFIDNPKGDPGCSGRRPCRNVVKSQTVISDINGRDGCHSDGTGMIRRDVLNGLLLDLPLGIKDCLKISIIQIRYGGAKGTLTAFDEPTKYLPWGTPKKDIYLRPSMIKFDAEYRDLEVCSVGKNVPYFLNRNVIMLLNTVHEIPASTFEAMQRQMLDDLDGILTDPTIARRLVPSLSGPDNEQRSMLLHMLHAGLSPADEPFLYGCLSAVRNHHIFSLRKKSRIFVEKGSILMGGIDETGLLCEGSVFFQVGNSPHVGQVMVTKHPVMHPGDVRMFWAIDVPELRNHHNMILFSRHGDRPAADQMSGSDLDGDEFAVCWDSRLFIKRNLDAMDYAGTAQTSNNILSGLPEHVSGDLIRHFLDHIKNAKLGQVAVLWLDHADLKGAGCRECLELAELHSVAVDYPKSGVPAIIPNHLKLKKGVARPHWREKKGSPQYDSKTVIGLLYDQVIAREKLTKRLRSRSKGLAGRIVDNYGTITCETCDPLDVYNEQIPLCLMRYLTKDFMDTPPASSLQQEVNELKEQYEAELMQIMNKYRIRSEGETFTGCIRKYHKLHKKRQHDFSQEVRRQYGELRRKYRRTFFERVITISENITRTAEIHDISEALADFQFDDAEEDTESLNFELEILRDVDRTQGHNEDYESNASIDAAKIREVENIVTKELIDPTMTYGDELLWQRVAFGLAAACYNAAYHPAYQDDQTGKQKQRILLFGFPWLVADVIGLACGPFLRRNENSHG